MSNIQHSSRTDRWFTPTDYIGAVHNVLGRIDLDPASEPKANLIVGAKRILTAEDDGLHAPWNDPGTVYLNPPGGKVGNKSLAALFWRRLTLERTRPTFEGAVFMAFSAEALAVTQQFPESIMNFPFCVPRKRIRFVSPDGVKGKPTHSSVIVYIPGRVDRTVDFVREFYRFGEVKQ